MEDNKKYFIKDFFMYMIMLTIIVLIIFLLCKHCELTKAKDNHVIKPATTTQTTTTTTALITETTTVPETTEVVTVPVATTKTQKPVYEIPTTGSRTTASQRTTTSQTTRTTTSTTTSRTTQTTTTTRKVDTYIYKFKVETSETKSFYILKNGVRMNEYLLVIDNNGNPISFSNNGVGSGLTMVNSNIDLSKCPIIKFKICNPQGLNCGTTLQASC